MPAKKTSKPAAKTASGKPKVPAKPKTIPKYGKPEETDIRVTVALWAFVALAVGGIIWMIVTSPPQKQLTCVGGRDSSLIRFGDCTEQ